jgi:hypothetical protein
VKESALIAFSTTSSEAAFEGHGGNGGIVFQAHSRSLFLRASFNLTAARYLALASVFVAQAAGVNTRQQLLMMLTLTLTSKDAGVPGQRLSFPHCRSFDCSKAAIVLGNTRSWIWADGEWWATARERGNSPVEGNSSEGGAAFRVIPRKALMYSRFFHRTAPANPLLQAFTSPRGTIGTNRRAGFF